MENKRPILTPPQYISDATQRKPRRHVGEAVFAAVVLVALAAAGGFAVYLNRAHTPARVIASIVPVSELSGSEIPSSADTDSALVRIAGVTPAQTRQTWSAELSAKPIGPSGLTAVVNSKPALAQESSPEDALNDFFQVLGKYKNRPAAQKFLADINADPALRKMFTSPQDLANPMTTIMKNPGAMATLNKYVKDPEFKKLMQEVTSDPEVNRVLNELAAQKGVSLPAQFK